MEGEEGDRRWGYHEAKQLPALLQWLQGGSDGEQETAERIREAFGTLSQAPGTLAPGQACYKPLVLFVLCPAVCRRLCP